MTIRLTDVARELIAAGLHGEQLLDALGRIEDRVLASGAINRIIPPHASQSQEDSGQKVLQPPERVLNRPSMREPGVDMLHD